MAVDPVKGNVRNPQSMVQYTYVQNNPILYVDPLGLVYHLTLMKAGGGAVYKTDILDSDIIPAGEKRYLGVRRYADVIDAARVWGPISHINYDVSLRNNAVVDIQYKTAQNKAAAMTLNLNHIGSNTEAYGVYFRYEQCGHTYVDLMSMAEKMGLQALIYSDAEYNAYINSVSEFYTGLSAKDYLLASGSQVALGNYSEKDVTILGTIGQIGAGVIGADLPADLRDIAYDLEHWNELVKNNPGQIGLDALGLLPVIGVIKYGDEAALIVKNAKTGEIETVVKSATKSDYLKYLDSLSESKIHHIIEGSKRSDHKWELLVPDKNWDDIKNIIADVLEKGAESSIPNAFKKELNVNGHGVEVRYFKDENGNIKIGDAWVVN